MQGHFTLPCMVSVQCCLKVIGFQGSGLKLGVGHSQGLGLGQAWLCEGAGQSQRLGVCAGALAVFSETQENCYCTFKTS